MQEGNAELSKTGKTIGVSVSNCTIMNDFAYALHEESCSKTCMPVQKL